MSKTGIASKTSPLVRVRKLMGYWCVQRRMELNNHVVWEFVNAYTEWITAYSVAMVEASPDVWPFHMEERTY